MPSAVLIVASTRAHADPQEILRIQDTVSALLAQGRAVDLLVPRRTPLLTAALPPAVRVFTAPQFPGTDNPPARASVRRFFSAALMFFRAVALTARRDYSVLHGIDDGAMIVRSVDRVTPRRYPYIAEIRHHFYAPGEFRGPAAAYACRLERSTLKHAAAAILLSRAAVESLDPRIPRARISIIPDPGIGVDSIVADSYTLGDFQSALRKVYDYVLRPRED